MTRPSQSDLIVLVADRDIEEALKSVLARLPHSLGCDRFTFEITRHPNRDGGCRADAAEFLREFQKHFEHALVVFDREGCGSSDGRTEIEQHVESELKVSGWQERGKAIVIDPELEVWLWSDSPTVRTGLGWNGKYAELRAWLEESGVWERVSAKPRQPKAALMLTLKRTRRRRSARLYGEIAEHASLAQCRDPAFSKLRTALKAWFPDSDGPGVQLADD